MKRTVLLLLAGVLGVLLLAAVGLPSSAGPFERTRAELRTGKRVVLLDVELAQTEDQRARGLMRRRSLARNAGMLFLFDEQSRGGFWMKNTRIPLDILYLDEGGQVVSIHRMKPYDTKTNTVSARPAQYAIELNAGRAAEVGVIAGDVLQVPTTARQSVD